MWNSRRYQIPVKYNISLNWDVYMGRYIDNLFDLIFPTKPNRFIPPMIGSFIYYDFIWKNNNYYLHNIVRPENSIVILNRRKKNWNKWLPILVSLQDNPTAARKLINKPETDITWMHKYDLVNKIIIIRSNIITRRGPRTHVV